MIRPLCYSFIVSLTAWCPALTANAVSIPLINPGGEAYGAGGSTADVNIPIGGVAPLSETGWQSTFDPITGASTQALARGGPFAGEWRLAAGARDGLADPLDVRLFQVTDHVVQEGDIFQFDFVGRGYFRYNEGEDVMTSLFGYVDGNGDLVTVATKDHAVITADWLPVSHLLTVGPASPLIGENLAVGFYTTTTTADGGFTSLDEASLTLVPEPGSLAIAGLCCAVVGVAARWRCPLP